MILWIIVLFAIGMLLSAFFSGSETGFYRVTRVRLVIDALSGHWVSRGLLWLTNNPALFVATTLIGNNIANYVVSLAIVLAIQHLEVESQVVELLAPIALAPFVFVYGELLPKNLFYSAPNLLLRRTGAIFIVFAVLFAPIAAILWLLGRVLESIVGETPLRLQLTLARHEIEQMLQEGEQVGILRPSQQRLAQNLLRAGEGKIGDIAVPVTRATGVASNARKSDLLRLARRQRKSLITITDPKSREVIGYVRIIDQQLATGETIEGIRPLLQLSAKEPQLSAILTMQQEHEEVAMVINESQTHIGVLYLEQLTKTLLGRD